MKNLLDHYKLLVKLSQHGTKSKISVVYVNENKSC